MYGNGLCFHCLCWFLIMLMLAAAPCKCDERSVVVVKEEESTRNGSSLIGKSNGARSTTNPWLELVYGLMFNYDDNQQDLLLKYLPRTGKDADQESKPESKLESKEKDSQEIKRIHIMKRLRNFMMMIPIGFQLLQLPMAIASVKASLLRSILVAKVALFMIFLRAIFTRPPPQKVVLIRTPAKIHNEHEHHEHYYHPWEDPEDNKPGWLGQPASWFG